MLRDLMPGELQMPILIFFLVFNGRVYYCFLKHLSYDDLCGIMLYGTVLTIAIFTLVVVTGQELLKIY